MIVLAPGAALWNVAGHAAWLTGPVIWLTAGCAAAAALLVAATLGLPGGSRCVFSFCIGLILTYLATRAITAASFVARPFVAYHFVPLYPHYPNTSFPSFTTACLALTAAVVMLAWRRAGWVTIALTAEVAFGCVYVGVHYVTDVVAGAAIGGLCGWAAWCLLGWPHAVSLLDRADQVLGRLRLRVWSAVTAARS